MTQTHRLGPVFDPGFLESLRTGTQLGELRLLCLRLVAVPLGGWVALPFLSRRGGAPLWMLGALTLAGAGAYAALRVLVPTVRPLPPGAASPADSRAAALAALRLETVRRLVIAAAPVALGMALAVAAGGALPYVLGFLLGWPLMVTNLPRRWAIEALRRHLASAGAEAPLWEALLQPAARGHAPAAGRPWSG